MATALVNSIGEPSPTENSQEIATLPTAMSSLDQRIWEQAEKLILSTMPKREDPVDTAITHNNTRSGFAKIPNELILEILGFVEDDIPSMFCIRQASRRFRGLIDSKAFSGHPVSTWHDCQEADGDECNGTLFSCWQMIDLHPTCILNDREFKSCPSIEVWKEIWSLIGRDRRCEPCLELMEDWAKGIKKCQGTASSGGSDGDRHRGRDPIGDRGEFGDDLHNEWAHCSGCNEDHPFELFTEKELGKDDIDRVCIARQGHVRLCQHETISLEEIETICQKIDPYTSKGSRMCQKVMLKECRHPSHQFGCSEGSSDYPRASISYYFGKSYVYLTVEWVAHSGPTRLSMPVSQATMYDEENGDRFPAWAMRDIATKFRNNAAQYLVTTEAKDHLPEMECFHMSKGCTCLSFQELGDSGTTHGMSNCQARHSYPILGRFDLAGARVKRPTVKASFCDGRCTETLSVNRVGHTQHNLWAVRELPCVKIHYYHDIGGLELRRDPEDEALCGNMILKDARWLYAMDRDSYGCDLVGTCADKDCVNHYVSITKESHQQPSESCHEDCSRYVEPEYSEDWEYESVESFF